MAFVQLCAPATLRTSQTRQRASCVSRAPRFSSSFVAARRCAPLCVAHRNEGVQVTMAAPAPPRILIVGAPASGKGTQCASIVAKYGVVHISTGDMLREAVAKKSELGLSAQRYMDAGRLVPDEVVTAMLVGRLYEDDCVQKGWLLDGFPRTAAQADALYASGVMPDAVIVLDVPDEVLVRRVVGRRIDPETGDIYHLAFNPPTDPAVLARLIQRSDDNEDKALVRLDTFKKHSEAVEGRYTAVLTRVDGNREKAAVFESIQTAIDAALAAMRGGDDDAGGSGGASASSSTTGAATSVGSDTPAADVLASSSMPVAEFVRRAEEAYERGVLEAEDVNWSGQAAMESGSASGSRNWSDVVRRTDLAFGDLMAFVLFAYIGRASHGNATVDAVVLKTAAPFIAAWFVVSPLAGAYTREATHNFSKAVTALLPSWALAVPAGLGIRGVVTQHPPPTAFVIASLVSTSVLLTAWRLAYVKLRGTETESYRRGGFFDGIKMVTTLLRRW